MSEERRFDPQKSHRLLDEERQAHWDPPRFLARLGIQPGEQVLDMGSGPGFWTLPLADIVGPEGHVWAVDVSQELLDILKLRHPPAHVSFLRDELPVVSMPDKRFDLIWAAFVFHEVMPPEKLAAEMHRLLRPQGRVAILEWRPDAAGQSGPPKHHRVSMQQLESFLTTAGFSEIKQTWSDDDSYLLEAVA